MCLWMDAKGRREFSILHSLLNSSVYHSLSFFSAADGIKLAALGAFCHNWVFSNCGSRVRSEIVCVAKKN